MPLSSPITQMQFSRHSASVAVLSGFISLPLTLTQQGLPWVCCPPVECIFQARQKSGSSCLGLGLTQVLARGLRKSTKELNLVGDQACTVYSGLKNTTVNVPVHFCYQPDWLIKIYVQHYLYKISIHYSGLWIILNFWSLPYLLVPFRHALFDALA